MVLNLSTCVSYDDPQMAAAYYIASAAKGVFCLRQANIYARVRRWFVRFFGGSSEKGKPVEKQGRKVSDLRGKTYDSGAAG